MKPLLITTFLLVGALIVPAIASPTCLIEVDGRRHLDGSCAAAIDDDGRLVLSGQDGVGAVIQPRLGDSDRGSGIWKNEPAGRIEVLGPLERDGMSCWRGVGVKVCAWGAQ